MNNNPTTSDRVKTLSDLFNHDKSLVDKSSATSGVGGRSVMSHQTAPARVAGKNSGILVSSSNRSRSPKRAQPMTDKDKGRAVRKVDFHASYPHPQRHRSTSAGRRNDSSGGGGGGGDNSPKSSSTVRRKLKEGIESVDGDGSRTRNRSTSVDLAASASSFSTTRTRSSSNDKGHRSDRPRELSRKSRSLSRDRSTESGSKSKQNTATRKGTRQGKRSEQDKTKNRNKSPTQNNSSNSNESSFKSTTSDDTKTTATTAASSSSSSSRTHRHPPRTPRSNKSRSPKRSPKRSPVRGRTGRNTVSTTNSGKSSKITSNRPTLAVVKNMNSANLLNELDQMDVATLQRMQDKIHFVMRVRSLSPDANERRTRRGGGDDDGEGGGRGGTQGKPERAKMSRQMSSQNADLADIILSMSFSDEKTGSDVNRSKVSPYNPTLSKSLGHLKAPSLSSVANGNSPNGSLSSNLKSPSMSIPSTPNSNQEEDQSSTPLRSNFLRQKAFFRKESPCETSTKNRKRQIALLAKSKGFIANIRANLRSDENKTNSADPDTHHQLLLQQHHNNDDTDDGDEGESDTFDAGRPLPRITVDKVPEQLSGFTRLDSSSSRSTAGWGSFDPTSNLVT
mmetsp:Transcript_34509/g.83274  ORF Transcript_34509/g.83274 Transcript_34509/m.83274 type:complete len:619 (+) Transcript_34509:158-2014(+)